MTSKPTSTSGIEQALTRLVGVSPKSQSIAMGIQSIANDIMADAGILQLKSGLKNDNYNLTEDVLRTIFIDECGVLPEEAKELARRVFSK